MIIKNKKAQTGHALTWIHKFFILVLVIGGIFAIVIGHYSKQYDIRSVEASIITGKIVECIAPDGKVKDFSTETIKNCIPIDEKEFYINITLENNSIALGDNFIAILCKAKEKDVKVKHYPSCLEERYYVLENNEPKKMNIFVGIKKIEKNL